MDLTHFYPGVVQVVAGSSAFSGQLVVTTGVLYYFPITGQMTEQQQSAVMTGAVLGGALGAAAASSAMSNVPPESNSLFQRPYLDIPSSIQQSPDETYLQAWLDDYIGAFRDYRSGATDVVSAPIRVASAQMRNVKVSFLGVLHVSTEYDELVFKVGLKRKAALAASLQTAGLVP